MSKSFKKFYAELENKDIRDITKEEYKKLFWTIYESKQLDDFLYKNYFQETIFITLSKIFFEDYIILIIESIKKSLEKSDNRRMLYLDEMCEVFFSSQYQKICDGFNRKSVDRMIEYFVNLDFSIYQSLADIIITKEYILEILSLDDSTYEFIKDLMINDTKSSSCYLKTMFSMKTHKEVVEDFFNIYDEVSQEKKKELYEAFIYFISNSNQDELFEYLTFQNIEKIFSDFYKLFDGNYKFIENMMITEIYHHKVIDNLWEYLIKNKCNTFLEKMILAKNTRLATKAKQVLDRLYNILNREQKSDHYKNILNNYKNTQTITSQDNKVTFDYEKLRDDLILISKQILKNLSSLKFEKENHINDRFISGLELQKYNIAGENRVNDGNERDIILKDSNQSERAIIEAFRITSIQKDYIKEHYDKLIGRYDPLGHSTGYILIYTNNKDFKSLWERYKIYLSTFTTFEDTDISDISNIQVGKNIINDKVIYHIFINFYSNKNYHK